MESDSEETELTLSLLDDGGILLKTPSLIEFENIEQFRAFIRKLVETAESLSEPGEVGHA